jgi:hypothetical protein
MDAPSFVDTLGPLQRWPRDSVFSQWDLRFLTTGAAVTFLC